MGELDRCQHLHEQRNAPVQVQALSVGVGVDRLAIDKSHRQPGLAVGRQAGVVEPGNVRVLQPRQDVALAGKALGPAALAGLDEGQLQRDLALHCALSPIHPPGAPDHAHAALAQRLDQPVRANQIACNRGQRGIKAVGDQPAQRGRQGGGAQSGGARPLLGADIAQALQMRQQVELVRLL